MRRSRNHRQVGRLRSRGRRAVDTSPRPFSYPPNQASPRGARHQTGRRSGACCSERGSAAWPAVASASGDGKPGSAARRAPRTRQTRWTRSSRAAWRSPRSRASRSERSTLELPGWRRRISGEHIEHCRTVYRFSHSTPLVETYRLDWPSGGPDYTLGPSRRTADISSERVRRGGKKECTYLQAGPR